MELNKALTISARGMDAQSTRLRVIAENLANQDSTGSAPGVAAYRRKTISFENRMDRKLGTATVQVRRIGEDQSEQPVRYDPSNPAANAQGYVKVPNVNSFIEMLDLRKAQRTYSANLSVLEVSRGMINRTIELLK